MKLKPKAKPSFNTIAGFILVIFLSILAIFFAAMFDSCHHADADETFPHWVYIEPFDNWDGDIASNAQQGDIVDILLVCEQFIPTNTEASSWGIVQVDLTIAEAQEYKQTSYQVNNPEPTPTNTQSSSIWNLLSPKSCYAQEENPPEQKILAYRKYKVDDLVSIGCDTVGLKISAESKVVWEQYRNLVALKKSQGINPSHDPEVLAMRPLVVTEMKKEKNKKDKNLFKSKIKEKKQKDIDDWKKDKEDKNK